MKYFYIVSIFFLISSCKKDPDIINNNNAPYYSEIPTLLLENYINRVYIDLIGREPLDQEMLDDEPDDAKVSSLDNNSGTNVTPRIRSYQEMLDEDVSDDAITEQEFLNQEAAEESVGSY